MATVNFRINKQAINDPTKIYVRFKSNDFDSEAPTEILVSKKDWSVPRQKIKPTANTDTIRNSINAQLDELKAKVFSQYNIDNHEGKTINTKWLKDVIKSFHNQPTSTDDDKSIFLSSFADYFAENSKQRINPRTGNKLSKRTILDFQNSSEKIKNYEVNLGQKIKLTNVDLKFRIEFIEYLRNVHFLGENTIGGIIDNLKGFLREADALGYKVHSDFKSNKFKSPSSKTKDIYFDDEEILLLKNHSFELDSFLDNARDWLIIGVWTGLRISDLLPLTKKDVKNGFIDNTNFKTKIPVTIPIHPHVKEVLDKRNGNFPRKISDQNFNDYIKKVAEEVGLVETVEGSKNVLIKDENGNPILDENGEKIYRKKFGNYPKWELTTSHICRRSFATNLYGKIDTLTIMKITGHQTEKQFLDYIKITPKLHAERLSNLWAELYKK